MKKNDKDVTEPKILNLGDDFSLIKNFLDGDESSFNVLVQRHKEKVRNIIFITMNSPDDADDIAQEVFITIYKNLKNFRFQSQFSTWLYRITVNKCRDHLRKKKIRKMFLPLNDEAGKKSFESYSVEDTDISRLVRKAISKLPYKLKTPLLLKDIEGMSYQEIAESMNCEIGTVKSRIFRAREGLKKLLEPYEQELL